MSPRGVWQFSAALAVGRFLVFLVVYMNQPTDALWQFAYAPLWIADFPLSVLYIALRAPIPIAEAVVGPIWWFCMPLVIGRWLERRRATTGKGRT